MGLGYGDESSVVASPSFSRELYIDAVRGRVAGVKKVDITGRNLNAGASAADVWIVGTTLTWLTAASYLNVASDNAGDTAAGLGAQTVRIHGLLSDFSEAQEVITLDGVTPVQTVNQYIRLNYAEVVTVGTYGGSNLGNITFTAVTGSHIQGRIGVMDTTGIGVTQKSHYTIPKDKTGLILSWSCSVDGSKVATFNLRHRHQANLVTAPYSVSHLVDSFDASGFVTQHLRGAAAMLMPAYTDLWITCKAAQNGTLARTHMELFLFDNSAL